MARNEKIAEKMGWIKYFGDEPVITDSGHKVSFQFIRTPDGDIDFDLKIDTQTAHLLIERMVGDGWEVSMVHDRSGIVMCAHKDKTKNLINFIEHQVDEAADFPAAVVELFCKVYDIRED